MLPAAKTSGDVTVSPAGAALTLTGGSASGVVTPKGAGISPSQHLRVFNDFRETDERICKSLGVDPEVGAAVMAKRWKETFVAHRDRLAGSGANAQKRGRVSRTAQGRTSGGAALMATVEKYETKDGATRYRVRYRTPDKRSTQKRGFTTKRDADLFAAKVEVNKSRGRVRRARGRQGDYRRAGAGMAGPSAWPSEGVDASVL